MSLPCLGSLSFLCWQLTAGETHPALLKKGLIKENLMGKHAKYKNLRNNPLHLIWLNISIWLIIIVIVILQV